jgi:putative sterol carrier protein
VVTSGVPRPPTAVVTIAMPTFLDLLAGRVAPATAQLTGKIRLEGEPIAFMMVSGLVGGFREEVAARGPRGWLARRLAGWIEKAK